MILNKEIENNKEIEDTNENNDEDEESYSKIGQRDDEREEINKKDNKSRKKRIKKIKEILLPLKKHKLTNIGIYIFVCIILLIIIKNKLKSKTNTNIEEISEISNDTNNLTYNETNEIIQSNTNEIDEATKKKNEEIERLNTIKNSLIDNYDKNGQINVIEFYEQNINNNSYLLPELANFKNIHINIGFTDDNIDIIIKHISSILYKAGKESFLHIHMMDAGAFNYDSLIKLKNMIYKINNSTEIIVYNATQVLKDFLIRADSVSKFSPEYAKLYAFKVLKDIKKIIFIDGDDCMVQKDLTELYNMDMEYLYARGITDEPGIRYSMNWMDKYLYDRTHYINGGVMLINLELCQKENFYEKAVKLNNDVFYTKTEEPAQDIINVLLRKKIEFFHPKYNKINFYENPEDRKNENNWYSWMDQTLKIGNRNNHFYTKEELIEADLDPVIIHYAWDRYLGKTSKKYEADLQFYANLTGIN